MRVNAQWKELCLDMQEMAQPTRRKKSGLERDKVDPSTEFVESCMPQFAAGCISDGVQVLW